MIRMKMKPIFYKQISERKTSNENWKMHVETFEKKNLKMCLQKNVDKKIYRLVSESKYDNLKVILSIFSSFLLWCKAETILI